MAGLNDNGRGSYGGGGYNNNRSGYSNSYNGNRSSSGSYNSRSSYGQQKELRRRSRRKRCRKIM